MVNLTCRWYYPIAIFYSPFAAPPGWATLSKCMRTVRSDPWIGWNAVHICIQAESHNESPSVPVSEYKSSVTQLTANDSSMAIRWRNTRLRLRIWNCWFGFKYLITEDFSFYVNKAWTLNCLGGYLLLRLGSQVLPISNTLLLYFPLSQFLYKN